MLPCTIMRAVRIHQYGGPESLRYEKDVPVPPSPVNNQVLVNISYAGINYIDTYHRTGLYALPSLPALIGREASGVVLAVGPQVSQNPSTQSIKVGSRVAFPISPYGSYAEQTLLDASSVVLVPESVSHAQAASVMLQGLTAHYLTHDSYTIKEKDVVLVHAAAGGTGALIVQMAKLRGGTVIATVGSEEKAAQVRSLGADHVIVYTQTDFQPEVMKLTGGAGVHAVYDGVGKATWEKSMKSLRRRGTLVLFGNASGPVPPIDPLLLSNHGSIYVTRPTLKDFIATPQELQERSQQIFQYLTDKQLHVQIGREFDLCEATEAHQWLENRAHTGKILLRVNPDLQ